MEQPQAPPYERDGEGKSAAPADVDSDLSESSEEQEPVKILPKYIAILGARGVGKTAVALRVTKDDFNVDYVPTIEDEYKLDIEVDGVTHAVSLLDTAGQSQTTSLNASYMLGVDGYVLVFNVASALSFSIVKSVNEKLMYQKWAEKKSGMSVIPRALVGNWLDVVRRNGEGRAVSVKEAEDYGKEFGIPYYECSALKGGQECRDPIEYLVAACHTNWMGRNGRLHETQMNPAVREEEQPGNSGADAVNATDVSVPASPAAPNSEIAAPPVGPDGSTPHRNGRENRAQDRGDRGRAAKKKDGGNCVLQ